MTVLARALSGAAARFGDRTAIVADGGAPHITYGELDRMATTAAAGLAHLGVAEGAVIALDLASNVHWVAMAVAASQLGAVTAGINPRLASPERDRIVEHLVADLVVDAGVAAAVIEAGQAPDARPAPGVEPDDDRVAAVVFSSGTTGEPKGATFTERNLRAVTAIDLGPGGARRWGGGGPMLSATQFAHVGFTTKLAWYLRTGATIHLLDRWRAVDALGIVEAAAMTTIGGVSAQVGLLLRVPDLDRRSLPSLRTLVVGGGPSPPALVAEAVRRMGVEYSIRYSSTESGGVGTAATIADPGPACAVDLDAVAALGVGSPRPGVEVRIDDATGEVLIRSDAAMTGWWRDPVRTAATIDADGWVRTGDRGRLDDDRRLHLVGRTTDMFIRGGYNVHPAEVEAALLAPGGVAGAAVVARPDPVMGEIGVAVVVPTDADRPPSLDELRAGLAATLAAHKLPEALVVLDALPLTAMDKVDRRALVALVAS